MFLNNRGVYRARGLSIDLGAEDHGVERRDSSAIVFEKKITGNTRGNRGAGTDPETLENI